MATNFFMTFYSARFWYHGYKFTTSYAIRSKCKQLIISKCNSIVIQLLYQACVAEARLPSNKMEQKPHERNQKYIDINCRYVDVD